MLFPWCFPEANLPCAEHFVPSAKPAKPAKPALSAHCSPSPGNNLEAGLGALVTKRLVGAHLAAKQAAAAAMQEQLEREQEVRMGVCQCTVLRRGSGGGT